MFLADAWMLPTKFYFIQPNGGGDYYLYKIFSDPPREGFASVKTVLTTGLKQRPANKEGYQPEPAPPTSSNPPPGTMA